MSARCYVSKRQLSTLILTMVTALAACAGSPRENLRVDWVVPGEHQIVVSSESFSTAKTFRVKYTDAWQMEEYALFRAGGMQLEIIYAEASRAFTVALDYQLPLVSMVSTWNLNSRQNIVWGPLGRIDNRLGTWFYRTYELSDIQKSCAGFMLEWDEIYEDPQGRPGKVVFGYFCGAEGEPLEDEAVRALIRGIRIVTPAGLATWRYAADDTSDDKEARRFVAGGLQNPPAIDTARGYSPSIDTGNPRFPFMFARYYSVHGGRKIH